MMERTHLSANDVCRAGWLVGSAGFIRNANYNVNQDDTSPQLTTLPFPQVRRAASSRRKTRISDRSYPSSLLSTATPLSRCSLEL